MVLARIVREEGHAEEACEYAEQALAVNQQHGFRYVETDALVTLGTLYEEQGRIELARASYERAIKLSRDAGQRPLQGLALGLRARLDATQGDLDAAERGFEEARACLGDAGASWQAVVLDLYRGHLDLALAHAAEARGDVVAGDERRARVRERMDVHRLQNATVLGPTAPPPSSPAPAPFPRLLSDVRHAIHGLERALSADRRPTQLDEPVSVRWEQRKASAPQGSLIVGPESRWFVLPGGRQVRFDRRGSSRRLLERLVLERLDGPGRAVSVVDLVEAVWPGDRADPLVAAHRVHTMVAQLRKLGLRDLILTRDDGYLLDADTSIERLDERS
jgi:hypothetical protein